MRVLTAFQLLAGIFRFAGKFLRQKLVEYHDRFFLHCGEKNFALKFEETEKVLTMILHVRIITDQNGLKFMVTALLS